MPTGWTAYFDQALPEDDATVAGRAGLDLAPDLSREVRVVPLLTAPGVTIGPSVARRQGVLEAIRTIPGIGEVRVSPIGGTIGPGGPEWLSMLMVARLPDQLARPLDLLLAVVQGILEARLSSLAVTLTAGRVAGAWCPGFSDLSVEGRKLVGVGFKLTREVGLMRAVVGLSRPDALSLTALGLAHRAIGVEISAQHLAFLGELIGRPELAQAEAIPLLAAPGRLRPAKIWE